MPGDFSWEQLGRLIEHQFAELHRRHDETNHRIDELTDQIKEQNGRVRKSEIMNAAHEADFVTIKDEIKQLRKVPRTIFGDLKVLALMIVGTVTATIAILEFFTKYLGV